MVLQPVRDNSARMPPAIPLSNRVTGVCVIGFGLLMITFCVICLQDLGNADEDEVRSSARTGAIASGVLSMVMVTIGMIIGFRDCLPKSLVATVMACLGLATLLFGIVNLTMLGYLLFIVHHPGLRIRHIVYPFVLFAVGSGFVKAAFSQYRSSDHEQSPSNEE